MRVLVCVMVGVTGLLACRSGSKTDAPPPRDASAAPLVTDATALVPADAALADADTSEGGRAVVGDAGPCAPMRVLSVHTSVNFEIRITPFSEQLRAKGKTKSYRAFHPALEVEDADRKVPSKHYLPACNFIPPNGGVPCVDFDKCEEPTADDREGFSHDEPPALACRGKEATLFRWAPAVEGVVQVFHAKPAERTWRPLFTFKPKGGCADTKPGVVAVQRSVNLDE